MWPRWTPFCLLVEVILESCLKKGLNCLLLTDLLFLSQFEFCCAPTRQHGDADA